MLLHGKQQNSPIETMLEHLLQILQHSQHIQLVKVTHRQLTITNQYVFLWQVLPRYAKKYIHKTEFIREMRRHGFDMDRRKGARKSSLKQKNEDQKTLCFHCVRDGIIEHIHQAYSLMIEKHKQKALLDSKIIKIKEILEESKKGAINRRTMELLDLVASLKPINRRAYQIQESLASLVQKCLQGPPSSHSFNQLEFSQSFLPQRQPFYSMQELAL